MATHDYVIANGTGAAVRSDLNGALAAIVSNNSSATAPATTYAYQWWADTTTGLLKLRNSANSAWISLFELDGTFIASDISLGAGTAAAPSLFFTGDTNTGLFSPGADAVALAAAGANRLHITSAGYVGLSNPSPTQLLHMQNASNPSLLIQDTRNNVQAYVFAGETEANFGSSSNHPIKFNVNDAEKARIDTSGRLLINTVSSPGAGNEKLGISSSSDGIWIDATGAGGTGIVIDRTTADGDLINFLQAGAQEGVISVSGTTVTYGGGHLARWSQLPNNEDPSQLLKGTVMSNLDEMCEWGDEDNEQLNKTKISDVEGDKNVAGVFVSTSFSNDGPLDFFVGMTGDMVIRIAEGVTVERGDLLMSAGDGTAKPQDDDIIRSKTIAKVTSTNMSCTYEDGSYCVPCVLMAC